LIKYSKESQIVQGNPYFIVMDSLKGDDHSMDVSLLRSYLSSEYKEKKKQTASFGRSFMGEHEPDVPQQTNSCDCGLFLLKYVEQLFEVTSKSNLLSLYTLENQFQNPGKFYWSKDLDKLKRWFRSSDIVHKREDIANLIRRLSEEQSPDKQMEFPDLTFSRRTRHSAAASRSDDLTDEFLTEGLGPISEKELRLAKRLTDTLFDDKSISPKPTQAEVESRVKKLRISKRSEDESFGRLVEDAKANHQLTPEEVAMKILETSPLFQDEAKEKDATPTRTSNTELFDSPKASGSSRRQVHLTDRPAKECLEIKITRMDRSEYAEGSRGYQSHERSLKSSGHGGSGRRSVSSAAGSGGTGAPYPRMRSTSSWRPDDERKRQRYHRIEESSFDHDRKFKNKRNNFHVKR
jgi:hypothetical protein